jgi:hypothetical protein
MNSIGSVTSESLAVPLSNSSVKTKDPPLAHGGDQAAARAAHLAQKQAADQLTADQAAKAAPGVIKIDEQSLKRDADAAKSADAAVNADQQGTGLLNVVA